MIIKLRCVGGGYALDIGYITICRTPQNRH